MAGTEAAAGIKNSHFHQQKGPLLAFWARKQRAEQPNKKLPKGFLSELDETWSDCWDNQKNNQL